MTEEREQKMKTVAYVVAVVLMVSVPGAFGADAGSGRFANHNMSTQSSDLPGGGRIDVVHYHQVTFADQPGHPLDNTIADCVGLYRFSKDDAVESASGSCFGRDADGDGTSFWWRLEAQGTADCPTMCGVWGYYAGSGKFDGISGGGTWQQTTVFPDAGTGTWQGTHSLK